jgi:nucleoid-associated protein YgaU
MGLERLSIIVEASGSKLQFGDTTSPSTIVTCYNPSKLSLSRSIQWQDQKAAKRDNPELQYTGAEPATLTIDLLFDTYDTPEREADKKSVKDLYTDKLIRLTTVEQHGDKHRPPVCQLHWGDHGVIFQGVLQQLQIQFTMFTAGGTPVRATANCTFKQWRPTGDDLRKQSLMSSDVAKLWVVKHGQSLATIAATEYGDPRAWRIIANANGIDNPLELAPGTRLLLPAERVPWTSSMSP